MYYRIYDSQTKNYMHTGYNATSLYDIAKQYVSYKSADTNENDIWEEICHCGVYRTLDNDEFILEKSLTKFEGNE